MELNMSIVSMFTKQSVYDEDTVDKCAEIVQNLLDSYENMLHDYPGSDDPVTLSHMKDLVDLKESMLDLKKTQEKKIA